MNTDLGETDFVTYFPASTDNCPPYLDDDEGLTIRISDDNYPDFSLKNEY